MAAASNKFEHVQKIIQYTRENVKKENIDERILHHINDCRGKKLHLNCLHYAALHGNYEMLTLFLGMGADITV